MSWDEITDKIQALGSFSDVPVKDFAPHEKWAWQIAAQLGDKMKTNQLRKVFHELKRIETEQKGKVSSDVFDDSRIYLLMPQLAYAKARKLITEDFYDLIKLIIGNAETTKLKTVGDYRRFMDFMTAIVAYHKK